MITCASDVPADIPGDPLASDRYARARSLYADLARSPVSDGRGLWGSLEAVQADRSMDAINPGQQVRTMWQSQYDIEQRSVVFEFYLGDNADGSPRRSPAVEFSLAGATTHLP